jgi:hypothetical protein
VATTPRRDGSALKPEAAILKILFAACASTNGDYLLDALPDRRLRNTPVIFNGRLR